MVVLVLDDPRLEPRELLVVLDEIGVQVTHADRQRPRHVGMDAGEGEASLVVGPPLLGIGVNLRIDESTLVVGARGVLLAPRRAIDDEQTDVLADLGSGKADSFGLFEREEHILGQFFHVGEIGRYLFAAFAKRLIPVNYNRIDHLLNSI